MIAIQFSDSVINVMKKDKLNALDAVIEVANLHGIDIEDITKDMITPKLLYELTKTAESNKLIKREARTKRLT